MRNLLLTTAAILALAATPATAASVAYINAAGGNINFLTGFGDTVTNLGDPIGLTAASLSAYDAVVVASNSTFTDPTGIGDALKAFADAGHNVVLAEFVFQGVWQLGGGIMGAGYSPFTVDPASDSYGINSNIGTIQAPGSALLSGVVTSGLSTGYQAAVGLDAGATLVADWDSGRHAIAYDVLSGGNTVVGLNFFPGILSANDEILLANAIGFTGQATDAPEPASMLLLGASLLGLGATRRKRA
jgi:hypothetical protein